jgi:DNA polymerase-1
MEPRKSLLFDIETNGLLHQVTKVHCISIVDTKTEELFSFTPDTVENALPMLYEADEIIGHNILQFDLPVLRKIFNWNPRPGTRRIDTLVVSRTIHPALKKEDMERGGFPGKLVGSHSLEAWGLRIGEHKAKYEGGWEEFNEDMLHYMEQDVRTNFRLLQYLKPWEYPKAPLELEHRVQEVAHQIELAGWPFDVKEAQELYSKLVGRRDALEKVLIEKFGTWKEIDRQFVAKRDNKPRGIVKGQTVTTWKDVTFNPGSRVHIEKKLREAGWEPEEFTPTGRAKINDDTLERLDLPEAKDLIEYLLIQKRLGQISDGDNGWLRVVDGQGLIHCSYNPMGTMHSRASHHNPNIGQVPNAHSLYGPECRNLFNVPKGWRLVGADMAGAQLRCLAHYIASFDNGAYGRIVTEGDIHTYHMEAASPLIKCRDDAKTTIYAKLFGATATKIGKINGVSSKQGQHVLDLLATKIPALGKLEKAVKEASKKKWLKGLDGRRVPVASDRLALNYLVTSCEAILCKTWMVNWFDEMQAMGYTHGWDGDFVLVGWVHDELQVAVRYGLEAKVGELLVHHAKHAGDVYGFKVALKGDYKVGDTWKETH